MPGQTEMEVEDELFNLDLESGIDHDKNKQDLEKKVMQFKLNTPETSLQVRL